MKRLRLLLLGFIFITHLSVIQAQSTVTGKVLDDNQVPLPGVNVLIEGTTTGTITNLDGEFSLSVPDGSSLSFSFVGFKTKVVEVGQQTDLTISLDPDVGAIEQVVVVGYGIQKRESVVGSITQATGEDLKKSGGTSNVAHTLAANLPGITSLQATGRPG
ncbi:MAG: carboxypeptidase-like regulatory domain-containing protein, partial [Bacteroidales bacterium]|nr:carboxypeptidase-like regulatory domain-containing protein [Bacteroidales bacterium]